MARTRRKTKRSRAKEAEKKRMTINLGIIIVAVLAVLWIAISANNSQEEAAALSVPQQVEEAAQEQSATPQLAPAKYDAPPPMTIDTNMQYFATVKMAKGGEFIIQLYPDKAPITVNNFVFLSREGFFDGTTFHRVLEGFMAQGGDPTGTGAGGPGYVFENEDSDLTFDKEGVVAMANAGRDTNGSQFFITFGPAEFLNGGYTIFGQVIEGMDVVNGITRRDPQTNPNFAGDVIESITISEKQP